MTQSRIVTTEAQTEVWAQAPGHPAVGQASLPAKRQPPAEVSPDFRPHQAQREVRNQAPQNQAVSNQAARKTALDQQKTRKPLKYSQILSLKILNYSESSIYSKLRNLKNKRKQPI